MTTHDPLPSHVFYRKLTRRYPRIVRGEGCWLYDDDGRAYLDASGGAFVVNVGHGVREIAAAVGRQAERLAYGLRLISPDVTIQAFYDANIQLTQRGAPFNFFHPHRPIYTHPRFLPATRMYGAPTASAMLRHFLTLAMVFWRSAWS